MKGNIMKEVVLEGGGELRDGYMTLMSDIWPKVLQTVLKEADCDK